MTKRFSRATDRVYEFLSGAPPLRDLSRGHVNLL
jgi:hypothetical protein